MRATQPIERLVARLKKLPGIGEKSATRLAFHLLGAPDAGGRRSSPMRSRGSSARRCSASVCFDIASQSPCAICRDERRDASLVCVVEEPADLAAIEKSGRFRGRYHVLGGAFAPIDGVGPKELRVAELEARVRRGGDRGGGARHQSQRGGRRHRPLPERDGCARSASG